MKIAAYTIAKNEAQFVKKWADSCKEADYRIILDTGSEDNTVSLARDLGVTVMRYSFDPWRFDHARNMALSFVPHDTEYCIALDMDEVLVDGWREPLEQALTEGITRPRYKYTWSWNPDGTPGLEYGGDKIHSRKNYTWKHPVHEVLQCTGIEKQGWVDLEIHHFPDHTKSRGQYFPLLVLAVEEDPEDDRNSHYLAREYYFHGIYDKAADEFKRHLSLPRAVWKPERAQSMRYLAKCPREDAIYWLGRAILECPDRREAYVDLANVYYKRGDWELCYRNAYSALQITEKPLEYLCDADAWGSLPYDLAAISAWNLGDKQSAKVYGTKAVELAPNDERLQKNLVYYTEG